MNSEAGFSSEGENDFFQPTQNSRGKDVYEVEWELDLVPRYGPKATPTETKPPKASEPIKKDRK